jgi:hypothetical protein
MPVVAVLNMRKILCQIQCYLWNNLPFESFNYIGLFLCMTIGHIFSPSHYLWGKEIFDGVNLPHVNCLQQRVYMSHTSLIWISSDFSMLALIRSYGTNMTNISNYHDKDASVFLVCLLLWMMIILAFLKFRKTWHSRHVHMNEGEEDNHSDERMLSNQAWIWILC